MKLHPLSIPGAYLIDPEPRSDDRGSFARAWCKEEFRAAGIVTDFVQANIARTARKGTIRGLHYQVGNDSEAKLVHCTRGAIFDVLVDVRPDSPAFGQWLGVELSSRSPAALYLPEGCAHGYQSLEGESAIFYLVTAPYAPHSERGLRYDDPALRVEWPLPASLVSNKDLSWPNFSR
jgi:dTDP-4-dehydrorhamnose 3,5-epimerase